MRENSVAINSFDGGDLAFLRELLVNRSGSLLSERSIEDGILSQSQEGCGHPLRVPFRAQQTIPPVLDGFRDTAVARRDYRQPARHRLEHRVGNSLDIAGRGFAWMKENVRSGEKMLQVVLRNKSRESDLATDPDFVSQFSQLCLHRSVSSDDEGRLGILATKGCEGLHGCCKPLLRDQSRSLHDLPCLINGRVSLDERKIWKHGAHQPRLGLGATQPDDS